MINNIKKLLKTRVLNTKNNRIYLQDRELEKTSFKPGEKISFMFDTKSKTLRIIPSDEGPITVSKRDRGSWINPVIDIRKKEVLEGFNDCDQIEVKIFDDEIIIKGYTECKENNKDFENLVVDSKVSNVVSFQEKLYKVESLKLRNSELDVLAKKASGDDILDNQISLSDYANNIYENINNNCNKISKMSKEVFVESAKKALRVISLCSGAGVLDKGFKDAGFEIVFAIDIDKDAVETYKHNIGNHIVHGDLNDLDVKDLPDAEVMIVGSPCQELTNANRVTGKVLDCEKNLLIRKIIDLATKMKSLKILMLENVPQLLTKGKKFINELKERLSKFKITINKVNSYDFGSPQKRERAIIVCSMIGEIEIKPPKMVALTTVGDAFKGLNDSIPNQLDYTKPKEETIEKMKYIPQGGNFKDIPEHLRGKGTHSNSYRRLSLNEPSITIANVRKSNILHPIKNRILTVRECCRLFDLDDSFVIKGPLSSKQQQIANAVPLALGKAIAKAIKEAYIRFNSTKQSNLIRI